MWRNGLSNMRVEPPKHSMRRTADLRGGVHRFRVWSLTHFVYLSAGGLHSSVHLGGEEDVSVLIEVKMSPKWTCFTGWAGRWPLDRPSREWTHNQILQVACRFYPFPCCLRGINLLAFTFRPNHVVGRPFPIVGLEWGVATRRTHSPNTSWGSICT